MASPEKHDDKKPGFDWAVALLRSFQNLKYTSPVGMLTLAIVAISTVFGLLVWRIPNSTQAVLITLIICFTAASVGFFSAVVLVIAKLGAYASLSGTQVTDYRRVEIGAKGQIEVTATPPISAGSSIAIPQAEDDGR